MSWVQIPPVPPKYALVAQMAERLVEAQKKYVQFVSDAPIFLKNSIWFCGVNDEHAPLITVNFRFES